MQKSLQKLTLQKNSLLKTDTTIIRILEIRDTEALIIDCIKQSMPVWESIENLSSYNTKENIITESQLLEITGMILIDLNSLNDAETQKFIREHYSYISGILPFVADKRKRNEAITLAAEIYHVSKQTIRSYLCLYLVYQDISALAPKINPKDNTLTEDEKIMRWSLNKFFYTQNKNSISTAYTMMLKTKYTVNGVLLPDHPSLNQFTYFERKHRKQQNYLISRNGLKNYQRNSRPLLGDGVQEFAPNIGYGMLDATILDLYLVSEESGIVGRPILTTCIDPYSGLCCGYFLSWEGGMYSLRGMLLNVIADKVEHCKKFGILIDSKDWNCNQLPANLVTDRGTEYISYNMEQITDLGVTIINLPSFRAELKAPVERFFKSVQDSFKPHLNGKGIIEPDFQERGVHDYRKDACLTMEQFEKILIHCIIYYNTQRVIEKYPYTEDMIEKQIKPYASEIWNYGLTQQGCNLIKVSSEQLILTLLPRAEGKFTRQGLKVNGLRYKHEDFTEKYLNGTAATVAYNPDDVSFVWLVEKKRYTRFKLIESRYEGRDIDDVNDLKKRQNQIVQSTDCENLQAKIDLASHIEAIVKNATKNKDADTKNIRKNRKREQKKTHIDYTKRGGLV